MAFLFFLQGTTQKYFSCVCRWHHLIVFTSLNILIVHLYFSALYLFCYQFLKCAAFSWFVIFPGTQNEAAKCTQACAPGSLADGARGHAGQRTGQRGPRAGFKGGTPRVPRAASTTASTATARPARVRGRGDAEGDVHHAVTEKRRRHPLSVTGDDDERQWRTVAQHRTTEIERVDNT